MDEVNSDKKGGLLGTLTPGQTFVIGLVGGIMLLCTIGFLVLLPSVFRGGFGNSNDKGSNGVKTIEANEVTNTGSGPKVSDIVKALDLDFDKFKSCVSDQKFATKINSDEKEAQAAGAQGTPFTVIIGPKGETVPIKGAYPFEVLDAVIKNMMGQKVQMDGLPTAEKITVRAIGSQEPVRGNSKAKISIIEYSDLECPFCKRFHDTMKQVLQAYPNDVRWAYRHMPLDSLHSKARPEAHMAECAGDQGKYWEFVDSVFKVTPANNGMDITL